MSPQNQLTEAEIAAVRKALAEENALTPREVIAMALSNRATCHEDDWDWFDMADAVIDALDEMEMTFRMIDAAMYCTVNETSAASMWRAMVGAMREEE